MKYTTLLLSGVPQKVKLVDLSYCLNRLFYADDEIGSFALRDLPNDGKKRRIALDFRSGYDAIAAQARLDSYHYKLPDGGAYTLCAKITWKEEFMRQQTSSPEPWREDGSEMGAEDPFPGLALVPTVSDGALYQANAKLDAQLELLKKQKLILRTERKLLKQKRKLKKEYASLCDNDPDDQPTTSKRRQKSRSRSPATSSPQDLQISSSRPKDPMPKLKALMSVEETKSTNLKRKKSRQKESRSRFKDRSPESRNKDVNDQRSKWDAFDIHPMDLISMSKRSVSDHRSKSPERSPRIRRSRRRDRKYTRSGSSKSRLRSKIKDRERQSRSTRSRSRERLASNRSRSRERPASYRSRSRERPASYRSKSRERPASYRSKSRERPASYRSRSRERPSSYRSKSRERPASYRSRSRERPASYRSRSREGPASYRSRSRERPASYRSRSRERPASYRSRSRERPASYRSRSRERPASYRSRSRERPASYRSRSRERPASYRSRSRERPASYKSRSRERLASYRSPSRERPAISYRSKSRERDPTRKENRPLAIMPKSPEIIRSPRTRRVSLTTTSQSKDAMQTNITIFVDVIPKKQVNGDKNETDDDSNHGKITKPSPSNVLVSEYTNTEVGFEAPVENKKIKIKKETSLIEEKATSSIELSAIKEKATPSIELSAIKQEATSSNELNAIKEQATSSKALSAIKEKATSCKELSVIKEEATSSKELSAIKEEPTTWKELRAIKEKATTSKELSAIKEKAISSKELSVIKEKATTWKELRAIKEKATLSKELSASKEKATSSKELSAIKEKATTWKELRAIKEKATSSKELSAIEEKATSSKKLSAIKEKATTSKDLSAIKEKATSSKELSAIKEKVTSSKELSVIKEKATSSKDLSAIKEKATSSKELIAIKEKATTSKELIAIKEKATTSKELSAIKEKATSSKELNAIKEKATLSKELSATKEKGTLSNILASKYTHTIIGSKTPNKKNIHKDLSANKDKATKSNVLVSNAHTKVATETPLVNTIHKELSTNKEKTTPSNIVDSEYSHTKVGSEKLDNVIERIQNIGNNIMRLMHTILEDISLKEKRELSENQKALIDGILNARILNRIKPLMAVKNVTEERVVLNYRELYSKEEDTLLISELLDGIPKETCKKDPSEVMDNIEISTISEATDRCSEPVLSTISWFTNFMGNQHDDQFRHNKTKECTEKKPELEKMNKENKNNLTITEVIDVDDEDSQSEIDVEKTASNNLTITEETEIKDTEADNKNNITIIEVIDLDNEDSQRKIDVEKTASINLTITEETEIKDTEADNKAMIIKDEEDTKPFKAKSKRVTKTAFIDITFDKDFCPIPARPQFVLVLKKLLKQMKNTINTADKKGLREFPISMFKCALRSMLRNLVAGRGYLGTCEIVKLFRAKYPKEEDYLLINKVIEDIKMGKYGKYTEAGQPEDKDDDNNDVILIDNKCDVIVLLDSDDDADQISEKPNLDDVKPIKRELQNIQHVEAEPTLQSQDQCNIVKAEPNDYPTTVVKETSQINKVITSNDKIPETQVTGSNVSAAYLPIKGIDTEKANQTNSSGFVNCTEGPIENIKQEIEPEFTDAAVENLLDSLKDFDNLNDINDTEKETPQVTAITIMTSFSELISLKNEINQSSDKVGSVRTDIEANDIKIENDLISNTMIETKFVPGEQFGHEISPNEGRDNNVRKGANDVRNNNDCNKVIQDSEVGKPNESGPTFVDGYVACNKNAKTVSRGDEEESIESISKYLDSICYY